MNARTVFSRLIDAHVERNDTGHSTSRDDGRRTRFDPRARGVSQRNHHAIARIIPYKFIEKKRTRTQQRERAVIAIRTSSTTFTRTSTSVERAPRQRASDVSLQRMTGPDATATRRDLSSAAASTAAIDGGKIVSSLWKNCRKDVALSSGFTTNTRN